MDQRELNRHLTRFFLKNAPPEMNLEEAQEFITNKVEEYGLVPDEVKAIVKEAESVHLCSNAEFEKFLFTLLEQHRNKNQN